MHFSTMQFDQSFDQRQTDSKPAFASHTWIKLTERLENTRQEIRFHTDAGVTNAQNRAMLVWIVD
mgnify:CR=1 FL=1